MTIARVKAGGNEKAGRWRPVKTERMTTPSVDCYGGGVPMGARIVIYADAPRDNETTWDFAHNVDELVRCDCGYGEFAKDSTCPSCGADYYD